MTRHQVRLVSDISILHTADPFVPNGVEPMQSRPIVGGRRGVKVQLQSGLQRLPRGRRRHQRPVQDRRALIAHRPRVAADDPLRKRRCASCSMTDTCAKATSVKSTAPVAQCGGCAHQWLARQGQSPATTAAAPRWLRHSVEWRLPPDGAPATKDEIRKRGRSGGKHARLTKLCLQRRAAYRQQVDAICEDRADHVLQKVRRLTRPVDVQPDEPRRHLAGRWGRDCSTKESISTALRRCDQRCHGDDAPSGHGRHRCARIGSRRLAAVCNVNCAGATMTCLLETSSNYCFLPWDHPHAPAGLRRASGRAGR